MFQNRMQRRIFRLKQEGTRRILAGMRLPTHENFPYLSWEAQYLKDVTTGGLSSRVRGRQQAFGDMGIISLNEQIDQVASAQAGFLIGPALNNSVSSEAPFTMTT